MQRFDVVLLPSFAQVEAWRKQHAATRPQGLFAQMVSTFNAWIADLWELQGDGRALVSAMQRHVLMESAFRQAAAELEAAGCRQAAAELAAPGNPALAARLMRQAAGLPALEAACQAAVHGESADGLLEREAAFLKVLQRYQDLLERFGLVEPGDAAALLARENARVFPRPLNVLVAEASPLNWVQRHFFSTCSQLTVQVDLQPGSDGVCKAPENVDLRFEFPSGRAGEAGLVADAALEGAASGDVVVVCKDPLRMFSQTQSRLVERGLHAHVLASKPFAHIDFGRVFLALCSYLHDDADNASALTDVLSSPFSGISQSEALDLDEALRADRTATRDTVIPRLCQSYETFSWLVDIATDPDANILLGAFEERVFADFRHSQEWRVEQIAAIGALRDATTAARLAGADIEACVVALERATVKVSAQAHGEASGEGRSVTFATQGSAAGMGQGCCALCVIADLTAEDYPVADKDDAASTLLAKLGIAPFDSALAKTRRIFNALLHLPTRALRIMRPLGDDNADGTYPCAALEEFIDLHRPDPTATDDIDNGYRLPASLQGGLVERGEELLFANAKSREAEALQAVESEVPWPSLDAVAVEDVPLIPARRYDESGQPFPRYCPSPSQLEAYMECPYKWFATRRLRIENFDEGFGALERGSFMHAALEAFYRAFRKAGHLKVTADNLDRARDLMRSITAQLAQDQFAAEPKSGRYVPITELESREMADTCKHLVDFLDYEAQLLPTFHPAYLEFEIGAEDAVEYAGYPLVGRVDRIDVDPSGHAVIIDYKSSVTAENEIADKTPGHPGKVQARIYARVVERVLGVKVVGALYVSCGKNPGVAGAYDPRVLDVARLPGIKPAKCACAAADNGLAHFEAGASFADLTFEHMLDATEQLAASAISAMEAGDVAQRPSHADACKYCPAVSCTKRGA